MKKYLSLFFVVIFPYIPVILSTINGLPFRFTLWSSVVLYFIAFAASMANLFLSVYKSRDFRELALFNMIIKLLHIPAYLILFFIGFAGLLSIKFVAITLIVFLYDCCVMLLSGLVGISAALRAKAEGRINTGWTVFFCISSFVFCIDVILAVVLFIEANNKKYKNVFI